MILLGSLEKYNKNVEYNDHLIRSAKTTTIYIEDPHVIAS